MNKIDNKITIITSGYFPVPAAMGGAVEALDENIMKQNELSNKLDLTIFSCFNHDAKIQAEKYKNTRVEFIQIPLIIQQVDKLLYLFAKNILKKEKSMSYRYILQRLYYIRKVAKKINKDDYGKLVIENHSTLFMILKKYNNYKKYEGRYYYHLHNVVVNDYGCKNIIANCKSVLGVSNYINRTLKEFLGKEDNNNYFVLKNKIDQRKFRINIKQERKDELRRRFNLDSSDKIVLFTGRFTHEKGIKELLLAFKKINHENVKLLIVGGYYFGSGMVSKFESEMRELALSMEDKIIFTGFIEYNMIPELYALADIVVIPSIWDDPAPLTVVESLTAGKALITTYSGGIPEYTNENSSILLKRDENLISLLSEKIDYLLDNPDVVDNMEEAVLGMTESWNLEKFYTDFCDLLEVGQVR
ncbi:glycosyltransferase family 4 protein [uncultured Clostridium sp.]|uniref:glycosyltransferase family 4 protein n=1 Tax=uncultured Clostridium sp. TaxID=59620 RepID=UPI0025D9726A|nr:glycosyltransferase family 4 protein [uncultured Clostridium sp.]MDU4884832.1 glycosyltransferase family 4 protein [Clostridium celatum]MDU7078059.1 glycosyltransferase family 4 protein [Clostridium celatum]